MRLLLTSFVVMICAGLSLATPYIPLDRITVHQGETRFDVPLVGATYNQMVGFIQTAGFEQPLQCNDPGPNFGGEREEESGYYYTLVETDNTLEAIQVWSRYLQLTGDTGYNDEIADAWTYAWAWPAWQEGEGYYSSHNCAWALAAELQYRIATGDTSQRSYALNSANYILNTNLPFTNPLNVMVTGWCCGNLYLYGQAVGNQTYMDTACQRAQAIMTWVEADPANRLSMESWAMSSGTFVWGLCNSIFKRNPAYGQAWLATFGPMVQVYEPTQSGWSNAWNVAYANAQRGMYQVTGNPVYAQNHLMLTNMLLQKDLDNDGGIPASAAGTVDASWVSNYLALMGCDYYLGRAVDAGVLLMTSPRNMTAISQGQAIPVTALLGNWGTQALSNVMVTCEGAYEDTLYVNLPLYQNVSVNFGQWTPWNSGIDSIWVTVHAPGDTMTFNNSDKSRFKVKATGPQFTYTASDTSLPGMLNQTTSFYSEIHNLESTSQQYMVVIDRSEVPPNPQWQTTFLIGTTAYSPFVDSASVTLPGSGMDSVVVYVTPAVYQADGWVTMNVHPVAYPWDNISQRFHVHMNPAPAGSTLTPVAASISPNPFNPTTVVSYELRVAGQVSLQVYDVSGRLVATLVNGEEEAGQHRATFDGSKLASGIYLVRLTAGGSTLVQKIVLMK